jgi:hypothetical protein
VLRAHADVRATFHKAWRDLVLVLESDEEKDLPGFDDEEEGGEQEKNADQDQNLDRDRDQDQDGGAGVTAEAAAEAVVPEEPVAVSTGSDTVSEPACGDPGEFLPFQPEKNIEQPAQPPDTVVACVESSAARVGCAKWVPAGGEEATNGVESDRSGPGYPSTAPAGQSAGAVAALTPRLADVSPGERCNDLHPDPPSEELTPRARSALEARNRATMADITMRGEPIGSEHPLRE